MELAWVRAKRRVSAIIDFAEPAVTISYLNSLTLLTPLPSTLTAFNERGQLHDRYPLHPTHNMAMGF